MPTTAARIVSATSPGSTSGRTSPSAMAASTGGCTAFVAAGGDADLSEVRSDFWRVRIDDLVTVLRRAGERGELHDGVDPYEAMRMFAGATLLDIIVADTPIRPDYIVQMLDIFVRGVSKNPAS